MLRGTVTRLVPEHGFGFIVDDSGLDWFFLVSGIRGAALEHLWVDQRVAFSSEWTKNGPRAVDIHFDLPADLSAEAPSAKAEAPGAQAGPHD